MPGRVLLRKRRGSNILTSFGLMVQRTFVQGSEVALSGLNCGVVVRIAVCTALLANALCGKSLHLWQHAAEAALQNASAVGRSECNPRESSAGHDHGNCRNSIVPAACRHPHSDCDHSQVPCSDNPRNSHDHNDCAICYVIGLSATSPELATVCLPPATVCERVAIRSESADTILAPHCDARGPPASVRA